jgi:ribonuclease BN (tRNA processing enzyme)
MTRYKSLAFRIEIGGRTIVFSGDSGWTEELVPFAAGADLFLCECTYFESGHLTFHLNYPLLAKQRARLDVKRLVLTHLGREVLDRRHEVAMEMAADGMRIDL